MLLLNGLGVTVNPLLRTTTSYTPGATQPSVYVEPTKPIGWTRYGMFQRISEYSEQVAQRARVAQKVLKAQYGAKIRPWREVNAAPLVCGRPGYKWGFAPVDDIMLDRTLSMARPLMVIDVLGVPFTLDEVNNDVAVHRPITRTYTPNEEQALRADYALYLVSQRALLARFDEKLDLPQKHLAVSNPAIGASLVTQRLIDVLKRTHNPVRPYLDSGEYATHFDGYRHNPVQSTPEELDQPDGLVRYYERGGFLLHRSALEGRTYTAEGANLWWSTGYVTCDSASAAGAKKPEAFIQDGMPYATTYASNGAGAKGWALFVKVSPGAYTLRLEAIDPSDWTKFSRVIGDMGKAMTAYLCSDQTVESGNQAYLATLCSDEKTGEQCNAGSPGCKCSKSTDTQNLYVAAARVGAKAWCDKYGRSVDRPQATPFQPPPSNYEDGGMLPQDLGLTLGQKIAIGLAGLGVGLALAKRFSR